MGKLTHTGKFRLTVGALDLLSQHAKYKVRGIGPDKVAGSWCTWLPRSVLTNDDQNFSLQTDPH